MVSEKAAIEFVASGRAVAHFHEIFSLHPKQAQSLASQRPLDLSLWGIGTGKSYLMGLKKLLNGLRNPGCRSGLLGRTFVKDVQKVLGPEFEAHVQTFLDATGVNLVRSQNKSEHTYTLLNGHIIDKEAYERLDKIRGSTWSDAVVDEIEVAGVDPLLAMTTILGRLRHPKTQFKQLCISTTPKGLRGTVAHFIDATRRGDDRYHVSHATVYDNPFYDPMQLEILKAAMSPREFRQECLAEVMMPTSGAIPEYDEKRHVIHWSWQPKLPWALFVDWEPSGYMGAVQIVPCSNKPYGYQWVVAREKLMPHSTLQGMRDAVERFIDECGGPPVFAACDRSANDAGDIQAFWLRKYLNRYECSTRWCETKAQQSIVNGMRKVQFMLDPPESDVPLLVFSDELDSQPGSVPPVMPIRDSMLQLRRKHDAEGNILPAIERNTPPTHSTDALRYLVEVGSHRGDLHGGRRLRATDVVAAAA